MDFVAFRLWAIEHLSIWPNRVHLLLAVVIPIVVLADLVVGQGSLVGVLVAIGLVVSLPLSVWRCNRPGMVDRFWLPCPPSDIGRWV